MKTNLRLTEKSNEAGYFYIYTSAEFESDLKAAALELLKTKLQLPTSTSKRTWETIEIFKAPSGADIGIVQDQFFGLVIESKDIDFLQIIFQQLERS